MTEAVMNITENGAEPPKTSKSDTGRKVKSILGYVLAYGFLGIVSFTCLFPFVWMVLSSFKTTQELNSLTLTLFAKVPQWHVYKDVFDRVNLFKGLLNTMIVEVGTIPACVLVSGMSAFAFSKMELKHKDVHLMVQLSALMIPYACVCLPLYQIYVTVFNLGGTLWPLILPSLFGGVSMMFFFVQFQRSIPGVIFEAAKIDGAGYLHQYFAIMVPMMGPAIAAQVIFMFVGNWNDYFAPSLYLPGGDWETLQVMIKSLATSDGGITDQNLIFACAVMASLPLYVIYIAFQKYFIEGTATSAVKG